MIEQYQLPVSSMKFCPDCDYEDNTTDLVMKHMVDNHKENILKIQQEREKRYNARMQIYFISNPPKSPHGQYSKLCDLE